MVLATPTRSDKAVARDAVSDDPRIRFEQFSRVPYAKKIGTVTPFVPGFNYGTLGGARMADGGVTGSAFTYTISASSDHSVAESGPRLLVSKTPLVPNSYTNIQDPATRAELEAEGFIIPAEVAGRPGVTTVRNFPGSAAGDLGEYFCLFAKPSGGFFLLGHSQQLTGVPNPGSFSQTQWVAESTAAQPYDFEYVAFIDSGLRVERHGVDYKPLLEDAGVLFGRGEVTGLDTQWDAVVRSLDDGRHWSIDRPFAMNHYPELFGSDRVMVPRNFYKHDGDLWAICHMRDRLTSGGQSANSDVVAVRMSDDFLRPVGIPHLLLTRGGAGSYDEVDASSGPPSTIPHPTRNDRRLLLHNVRNADEDGTIAMAEVFFDGEETPPRALTMAPGYGEFAAHQREDGTFSPFGPHERSVICDDTFGVGSSLPAHWLTVTSGGATIAQQPWSTENQAGGLLMTAGSGENCLLFFDWVFHLSNVPEYRITLYGIRATDADFTIQVGLRGNTGGGGQGVAQWDDRRSASGIPRFAVFGDGSSSANTYERPNTTMVGDNRWQNPQEFTFMLSRPHASDGNATQRSYCTLLRGGGMLAHAEVTANLGLGNLASPCVRYIANDASPSSLLIERIKIEAVGRR